MPRRRRVLASRGLPFFGRQVDGDVLRLEIPVDLGPSRRGRGEPPATDGTAADGGQLLHGAGEAIVVAPADAGNRRLIRVLPEPAVRHLAPWVLVAVRRDPQGVVRHGT